MSNSFLLKFQKWLILTASWVIIGGLLAIYLDLYVGGEFMVPTESYSTMSSIINGIAGGLLGGLLGGSIMIFVLEEKFKNRPFAVKVLINAIFVMLIILIVNIILSVFYALFVFFPAGFEDIMMVVRERLFSRDHIISQLTWFTIVSVTTFGFNIADSFGPRVFLDILLGKYHRPFTEQRIFMFLDIKSSTSIAEKLGHQTYFSFLQEFFADITNPVLDSAGRIYQYVGDEVVLSWDMQSGIKNRNCLNCFFRIEDEISQVRQKYLEKYGIVPQFKAGVHYGKVTTGEVGMIKKEIIHTGDVLNTTSRIETQCNWLNAKLLASKQLIDLIGEAEEFRFTSMGKIDLRGKMEMVELVEVEQRLKIKRELDAPAAGAVEV